MDGYGLVSGWAHGWMDEYGYVGGLMVGQVNRWDKWMDK